VTFLFFIVLAFASVELTRAAERDADAVPAPTTRRF
jgi:hypothetical protein